MLRKAGLLLIAVLLLAGCSGKVAFQKGEKFSLEGDYDRAVMFYRQALREDPENVSFKTRLTRVQDLAVQNHAQRASQYLKDKNAEVAVYEAQQALAFGPESERAKQLLYEAGMLKELQTHFAAGQNFYAAGRPNEALDEFAKVLEQEPDNPDARAFIERITKQRATLNQDNDQLTLASDEPITLSFKDAKLKEVFEFLSKISGVSILFDEDVKDSPVTVFAKDVTFNQALKLLLATNKLFMKKIAADTIIVVPKTKSKQDQYQDLQVRTFYLSNIQAKEMVNIVRTMLETRKIIINDTLNSITLRETPDKIRLAEKLITANDRKDSEVIIDVAIMSVDKSDSQNFGISLPKGVSATYFPGGPPIPTSLTNTITTWKTFTDGLKNSLNHGANAVFSYPAVSANWSKSLSNAETLTNPQIRALNNKPAKILIGRRIPVQTGTTVVGGGATTTTFEYRDVGIKLTIEPNIGLNNDVTLKTTLEVSSLGDNITVGDLSEPTFNTTTAETTLNLKDGETVIIGGLVENINSISQDGIIGLIDIPLIGKLLSSRATPDKKSKRELVMTMTPRIVRGLTIPEQDVTSFWSGTEESYDTKPMFEERKEKLSVPEETAEPSEGAPATGPVPSGPAATEPGVPAGTEGGQPSAANKPAAPKRQPGGAPVVSGEEPPPPPRPSQRANRVGTLSFAPEVIPVEVGQEVTVDVMATDTDSIFEAPLSIIYNPKLVEFLKADEGEFMKIDGKPTSFSAAANDKVGYIDVFVTRLGKVSGVAGTGRLFSLTFKGKAPGISPLVFKQNTLRDANRQSVAADLKTGTLYVK